MVVKLYCENGIEEDDRSPIKLQELMEKAMEQVRKTHYSTFYKHLPIICDLVLGPKFL
jgi:hypothetical protein